MKFLVLLCIAGLGASMPLSSRAQSGARAPGAGAAGQGRAGQGNTLEGAGNVGAATSDAAGPTATGRMRPLDPEGLSEGAGYRFVISNGVARVPVVVVSGTPYQMGWQIGHLMKTEIREFLPSALARLEAGAGISDESLDKVWATTAAYTDDRFEQEVLGIADGADIPLRTVEHVQCLPLLMPYSCSSIAAWGKATEDGHLYQTRDLDWSMKAGAHNFPALVVYLPAHGIAHVIPTFAGVAGANCGMNADGLVLSEMGDSPVRDEPYNIHAPHFMTWFRTLLWDAPNLSTALDMFRSLPLTKSYHFVFGDGRAEHRAVKIRLKASKSAGERVWIWKDDDSSDELAPNVLKDVVYQDEGRGAFPLIKKQYGRLNGERLQKIACAIPIRGGNVMDVVFDATALRLWVSYAAGTTEAYQRPFVFLDFKSLLADRGAPTAMREAGRDAQKGFVQQR